MTDFPPDKDQLTPSLCCSVYMGNLPSHKPPKPKPKPVSFPMQMLTDETVGKDAECALYNGPLVWWPSLCVVVMEV